ARQEARFDEGEEAEGGAPPMIRRPAAAAAESIAGEEGAAHAEQPAAAAGAEGATQAPGLPPAPQPRIEVVTPNLPGMRGPNVPVQETANLRPTATQAVVISRPLIPVRRVTPPTSQFRPAPAAPGRRAIGEMREVRVVPDSMGR